MPSLLHNLRTLLCRIKPKLEDAETLKSGKSHLKISKNQKTTSLKHQANKTPGVRPSTNNKQCIKNIYRNSVEQQRNNNNMPACENNNRAGVPQGSKKGSRKKNKYPPEYNYGADSEREHLKAKTSEKLCFERVSNLSGSSNRSANSFNDKFNRRFNNNPQQRNVTHLTLGQYSQFNFPPPVRRYPSARPTMRVETTKSTSQLNYHDPNRFQTPPNRCILKNDGNEIISRCRDQFYVQSEPGSCASTNSAPPTYSPLSGASRTDSIYAQRFRHDTNYVPRSQTHDPPPEYSEPPSYFA